MLNFIWSYRAFRHNPCIPVCIDGLLTIANGDNHVVRSPNLMYILSWRVFVGSPITIRKFFVLTSGLLELSSSLRFIFLVPIRVFLFLGLE